jgi:hypothetical protein
MGDEYEEDFLNVCVLNYKESKLHSGESDNPSAHVFYLRDVQDLLSLRVCPKCNYHVCQIHRYNGKSKGVSVYRFNEHVDECDGRRPEKRLKVRDEELPFAPGMFNNQTYLYLKGHNRMNEWKPDRYFMVFDLKTVEIPIYSRQDQFKMN